MLILSAIAGFVLQQSALKTVSAGTRDGIEQRSTLVFSAVFGLVIFDERLTHGGGHLALAYAGLALAVVGVAELAGTSG